MDPLPRPSRTGARIAGDMYQWLHAWEGCLHVLRHYDRPTANPVIAVGIEVDDAGNLDDVVLYRVTPPHIYAQVKYAVDATTQVNGDFLLKPSPANGPSILAKIVTAWRELTVGGDRVHLALITNREIDPKDPLASCRDARNSLLMPGAGEGSARSARGKARSRWAATAGLPESELLRLLAVLRFDTAVNVPRLRESVAVQMSLLGLPEDDEAVEAGIHWIARQVRDGHRKLGLSEIDQGVVTLWPQSHRAQAKLSGQAWGGAAQRVSEDPDDERLAERLNQLPKACEARILAAWRDQRGQTWQLVTSLTSRDVRPTEVSAEWARHLPAWLGDAAWQVQLAAGELVGAYGASRLAAELFRAAVAHGALRREYWLTRAALIYHELENFEARDAVLDALGSGPLTEPYARAAVALVAGNVSTAAEELAGWSPDPGDQIARAVARVRVALAEAGEFLTRESIDQALRITAEFPPMRWSGAVALTRARLLMLRARRGESPNRDTDLREAADLLVKVRDERRAFRGNSAEAVEGACQAALLMSDPRTAIRMGTPGDAGATPLEADSAGVRERVVEAALEIGDLARAREYFASVTDESVRAQLAPLFAEAEGRDATAQWRRAIELAKVEQLPQALYGLARNGTQNLPRLEELAAISPDIATEIRAVSQLATGDAGAAIARLRSRRTTSMTAAINLAQAYAAAGKVDDQVQTLTDAADHFGDPSLRFAAAEALTRTGRTDEAQGVLEALLTSAEWNGRGDALRLAARLARDDRRLDRACDLLGRVLVLEPDDARTRWTLVHILLSRGDVNAAWRALSQAPEPLDPTNVADARVWIQLNRRRGRPTDTVAGCLRLLLRFADDEEFNNLVITNLILPGLLSDELPEHLTAEVQAEMDRFFQRWPASTTRRFQADDAEQVIDHMRNLAPPPTAKEPDQRRLLRALLTGKAPFSYLAAAAGKTYAEVLIRRGGTVIPARHPDPDDLTACAAAARHHADKDIVIDTAAAVVLLTLPAEVREAAIGTFARLMTTDNTMLDALAANDTLALRSTATMRYDEQLGGIRGDEISPTEADRIAREAAALLTAIEQLARMPQPATSAFERPDAPAVDAWASVADLAGDRQIALWSDDPILRAHARQSGIQVTSTPAVLDHLLQQGRITAETHEQAIRAMIKGRIGDMPFEEKRLLELAEDELWAATHVALAMSRPAAWIDADRAANLFGQLVSQASSHNPTALPDWLYCATQGAAASRNTPAAAADISARLLAIAIHIGKASSADAVPLVTAVRTALKNADDPDQLPSPDPIPACARILRDNYKQELGPGLATRLALSIFGGLPQADRTAVLQALLA